MGPALLAPDDERMPLVWPEKAAGGGLRGSRSRPPAALASLVRGARARRMSDPYVKALDNVRL